jgi:hypothetical protein
MAKGKYLILDIEAYSPETMPMARLAEYMADLAMLLGEKGSVHFVHLGRGSTRLVHRVDREAVPKVEERLRLVKAGAAPSEAQRAAQEIDRKLAEDNASGALVEKSGAEIIPFPGIKRLVEPEFGPFNEPGTIDGIVIRVGGQKKTVPVHLQTRTGIESNCHATRAVAKELAKHIFGPELRCSGTGRWYRDKAGNWEMRNFVIAEFTVLDSRPLADVVAELQAVEGNGWRKVPDPWAELAKLRSDGETEQ